MSSPSDLTTGRRLLRWWLTFLSHHRPALVGFVLSSLILLVAVFGPLVLEHAPDTVFGRFEPQGAEHLLGTDSQGYDVWARIVHGGRVTLWIALSSMLLSLTLGTIAGAAAGYLGGWVDLLVMRGVDFAMSFPSFLLAMVAIAILGARLENLVLAVGLVGAPIFARQVRAEVLRVKTQEYVTAARALGFGRVRILFRHVLPNCFAPIVVLGTLTMGSAILDVAGLNFLGLGGDPYTTPEWGLILKQGWEKRPLGNLQVTAAGLAIFLTVLGFNLLGDGLKDELDPRTRRR
ncbi:MAG: ABC transporter permease [Planctomycetes bacterium]|nr:ABC transporter permease [Planctomycetota bacterium]